MKNKIYKGILGGIVSLTVAFSLSACSTPGAINTTNTPGMVVGTSANLNQNSVANSNMPTPQTRVS